MLNEEASKILRFDEAMLLLRSVDDLTTNQLMNTATFEVLKRFSESKELPVADFDLRFFMEAMLDFCSKHNTLRQILAGEDLRLWTDDDLKST